MSNDPGLACAVLVGHANQDVHFMQVMEGQQAAQLATEEAKEVGKLTNSGFRTIVAAVWMRAETKSAGLSYAAAWNENEIEVLLHYGDRLASSHELYSRCVGHDTIPVTSSDLLRFCKLLKIN